MGPIFFADGSVDAVEQVAYKLLIRLVSTNLNLIDSNAIFFLLLFVFLYILFFEYSFVTRLYDNWPCLASFFKMIWLDLVLLLRDLAFTVGTVILLTLRLILLVYHRAFSFMVFAVIAFLAFLQIAFKVILFRLLAIVFQNQFYYVVLLYFVVLTSFFLFVNQAFIPIFDHVFVFFAI